jgi:hypothetical protein
MNIPSIELSERTLTDICEIINEQMKQGDDDKPNVTYEIKEKTRDFETHNSEDFIRKAITRDLKRIKIWYQLGERRITIDIAMERWGDSDYTVEGNDRTWVDGITARLDAIFKKYKTNNDLFHGRWKNAIPIYIGLAVLVAGTIISLGMTFDPVDPNGDNNLDEYTILGGVASVLSLAGWYALLNWLFPKSETEFTPQRKYRKKLLAGISFVLGTIVLGLFVNYLSSIFG